MLRFKKLEDRLVCLKDLADGSTQVIAVCRGEPQVAANWDVYCNGPEATRVCLAPLIVAAYLSLQNVALWFDMVGNYIARSIDATS